jgi:hypothetical protein
MVLDSHAEKVVDCHDKKLKQQHFLRCGME